MKQLAAVQFFTWMGLILHVDLFQRRRASQYSSARQIRTPSFTNAGSTSRAIALRSTISSRFSPPSGFLWLGRKVSAKWIHFFSLLLGGLGLASLFLIREPWMLLTAFAVVGIAWASILSMPYAMLSSALPAERMGVYMGIFNFFIVIPQILIAVGLGRVMEHYPQVNRLAAVVFGGVCMLIAALVTLFVPAAPVAPARLDEIARAEGMIPSVTPPEAPTA